MGKELLKACGRGCFAQKVQFPTKNSSNEPFFVNNQRYLEWYRKGEE